MNKNETGKFGENCACDFLRDKGYKVLDRNYRRPWGEIDIIAELPSGVLVFVEVKTMRQNSLLPEDNFTQSKLKRIIRTAELLANGDYFDRSKKGWQVDLVAIEMQNGEVSKVVHYENVAELT